MLQVKDTLRATVHLSFDGRVAKVYHGPDAQTRFDNEVRVLRHLEKLGCNFVPRLLEADPNALRIVTSNCGTRVDHLDAARCASLFAELAPFGVRHDDPDIRNVTYRQSDGRFCVIDFEFAAILPAAGPPVPLKSPPGAVPLLKWHGITDRGRVRPNNEDAFLGLKCDALTVQHLGKIGEAGTADADFVFAVSDGMGGAMAGEYASRIAVEKITTLLPRSFHRPALIDDIGAGRVLTELFRQIHRALKYLGSCYEECADMETTLSLCWFTSGRVFFAHVGDSRIYHLPRKTGDIRQLSQDDTYVGWLFRNGQINEREARTHARRNVLQKALGGGNQFVDPQVGSVACETGDKFLLCTDGLAEGLYNHSLLDLLRPAKTETSPGGASANPAKTLVETSIARDGRDNVTALVIEVAG